MNSFGICFFPAVVTRYKVKSSIRNITHEDINFERFSKHFLLVGDTSPAIFAPNAAGEEHPATLLSLQFGALCVFGDLN